MKKLFLSLALALSIASAQAQPGDCIPADKLAIIISKRDGFSNLRPISPDKTPLAIQLYMAIPPVDGKIEFDEAMLLDRKDGGGVLFVGTGGAMCSWVPLPPNIWQKVLKRLEGEPA